MWAVWSIACSEPGELPPPQGSLDDLARVAPLGEWVQDCDLPPGCDDGGLPADRCVADPAPFTVTLLDGEVVSLTVDLAIAASLGLADGTWWTAWSDGVSCARVTTSFELGEPGEVTP